MGGYGSGRPITRPSFADCGSYRLSTRDLHGWLRAEQDAALRLTFDVQDERMTVHVEVNPASGYLRLQHRSRARDSRPIGYRVPLASTPCGFGGQRWWFLCPLSGQRCAVLWLPRGGTVFATANAYQLPYGSTRRSHEDRLWRKMAKIARRLGEDDPVPDHLPTKPRWMRWSTYTRLEQAWLAAHQQREAIFTAAACRLIARLAR